MILTPSHKPPILISERFQNSILYLREFDSLSEIWALTKPSKVKQQSEVYLLISYKTELLRDICFHSSIAIEYLGEEAAVSLQARHSDIQAASNVFELPVGRVSIEENLCTLAVLDFLSIVMAPNYPTVDDGTLYDWATVGRVKLMGINDVE